MRGTNSHSPFTIHYSIITLPTPKFRQGKFTKTIRCSLLASLLHFPPTPNRPVIRTTINFAYTKARR